jgi:hypothetical protein
MRRFIHFAFAGPLRNAMRVLAGPRKSRSEPRMDVGKKVPAKSVRLSAISTLCAFAANNHRSSRPPQFPAFLLCVLHQLVSLRNLTRSTSTSQLSAFQISAFLPVPARQSTASPKPEKTKSLDQSAGGAHLRRAQRARRMRQRRKLPNQYVADTGPWPA